MAVVHTLPCCLDRVLARDTPAGYMMWVAHTGGPCRLYMLCTCGILICNEIMLWHVCNAEGQSGQSPQHANASAT